MTHESQLLDGTHHGIAAWPHRERHKFILIYRPDVPAGNSQSDTCDDALMVMLNALVVQVMMGSSSGVVVGSHKGTKMSGTSSAGRPQQQHSTTSAVRRMQQTAQSNFSVPTATCLEIRRRGQCDGLEDMCALECAGNSEPAHSDFRWSCPVLLELQGGCSHDLSAHDPTTAFFDIRARPCVPIP